jgi:transcription initiation factor TFIIIB Brf1 subunit/transcription initiation factor TFIIB
MAEFNLSYLSKWQQRVAWSLASDANLGGGVAQLHDQVMRLQQTVIELATVVNTMALLLVDRGGLDPKLLEAKVAAALAAHHAATPSGRPIVCSKCGAAVTPNLTVITVTGVICDKCAAAVAP